MNIKMENPHFTNNDSHWPKLLTIPLTPPIKVTDKY